MRNLIYDNIFIADSLTEFRLVKNPDWTNLDYRISAGEYLFKFQEGIGNIIKFFGEEIDENIFIFYDDHRLLISMSNETFMAVKLKFPDWFN